MTQAGKMVTEPFIDDRDSRSGKLSRASPVVSAGAEVSCAIFCAHFDYGTGY